MGDRPTSYTLIYHIYLPGHLLVIGCSMSVHILSSCLPLNIAVLSYILNNNDNNNNNHQGSTDDMLITTIKRDILRYVLLYHERLS